MSASYLPIKITGKGRIPRLGVLAPQLTPINCSLLVVEAIVKSGTAHQAIFVDPANNDETTLTAGNYREVFNKFNDAQQLISSMTIKETPKEEPKQAPIIKKETPTIPNEKIVKEDTVVKEPTKVDDTPFNSPIIINSKVLIKDEVKESNDNVVDKEVNKTTSTPISPPIKVNKESLIKPPIPKADSELTDSETIS